MVLVSYRGDCSPASHRLTWIGHVKATATILYIIIILSKNLQNIIKISLFVVTASRDKILNFKADAFVRFGSIVWYRTPFVGEIDVVRSCTNLIVH